MSTRPSMLSQGRRRAPAGPRGVVWRAVLVVLATIPASLCAVGFLYLLRDAGGLAAGPRIGRALALQRLAQGDAQPLLRVVVAWLPAGVLMAFVAGALLPEAPPAARALLVTAAAYVVVLVLTAAADSVTASESLGRHLHGQPGRAAVLVPAAVVGATVLVIAALRRPRR